MTYGDGHENDFQGGGRQTTGERPVGGSPTDDRIDAILRFLVRLFDPAPHVMHPFFQEIDIFRVGRSLWFRCINRQLIN